MAYKPNMIIAAGSLSLLLAMGANQAAAQGPDASKARAEVFKRDVPVKQESASFSFDNLTEAIANFYKRAVEAAIWQDPAALAKVEAKMRSDAAEAKRVRNAAIAAAIKADPSAREAVAERMRNDAMVAAVKADPAAVAIIAERKRNEAIAAALRANPELLRNQQVPSVPNTVTDSKTPIIVKQPPVIAAVPTTPVSPVVPVAPPKPAPVTGSARLSWNIPTQRENGESLSLNEIASYEIYVTAENAGSSRTIRLDNRNQTQFTLEPLSTDTYYFSMVTIDTDGMYSELSQVVSKTIGN
ncbi:MAG: fibronectin type III domain-containing protein [Pseudomonadales bacterium]